MNEKIATAGIVGIGALFILLAVVIPIDYWIDFQTFAIRHPISALLLGIIYFVFGFAYAFFMRGFALVGQKMDSEFLMWSSYFVVGVYVAAFTVFPLALLGTSPEDGIAAAAHTFQNILAGGGAVVSGIALFALGDRLGPLTRVTAIAEVGSGVAVIFNVGEDFVAVPFLILGAILLFQVANHGEVDEAR